MRPSLSIPLVHVFVVLVVLLSVALLAAAGAKATTLDPSHPLWDDPRTDIARWIRALEELEAERAVPLKWHDPVARRGRAAAVGRRVLVIPVVPADAGELPRTQSQLRDQWSGPSEASVRGYWEYVSGGALNLEVTVLPWLSVPGTLQSDYPNIINGAPATNLAAGPRNMATDALTAAASVVEDLHAYDDDGPDGMPGSGDDDGILDLVVVLHPFPAWEVDPIDVSRAIVSLQARLGDLDIPGTDLQADAFFVAAASGPLGVWVHEFGHLLGLADLYDLDRSFVPGTPGGSSPQGGLGRWSLMASGTWGGDGNTPSGLDAWSRSTLGFGEVILLDREADVTLPWIGADETRSLRVRPLGDWGEEAFLIESRSPRPGAIVDAALPGEGALVYHERPDLRHNTTDEKFVELIQADGLYDLDTGANDGDASDPYDGSGGRELLDGNTVPSSESSSPSTARTPPVLNFVKQSDGMRISVELASGPALRLETFAIADPIQGLRTWLRPAEQDAELAVRFASVGPTRPASATLSIAVSVDGRPIEITPSGPLTLVPDGDDFVLEQRVGVSDPGSPGETGVALLELSVETDGSDLRTIDLGLPVVFSDGLRPDALARFEQDIASAGPDTTRFVRLASGVMPRPALVGYELQTAGQPGYADSVELSLVSPWFSMPLESLAWLWTRGQTERGIPGQVFDGAALEVYLPDRGWAPMIPDGSDAVYIVRSSAAATRDRMGFGGDRPDWTVWSARFPANLVPARVRVRFASDASIAGGRWEVSGLQTDPHPQAHITLETARDGSIVARARIEGDLSRVDVARYRYRENPNEPWAAASAPFSVVSANPFGVVLTRLPEGILRAEIGLFSGIGDAEYQLGSTGLYRDPPSVLPELLENPSQGEMVLQAVDQSSAMSLSIYDVRGRRRARLTIPAHTTWFEYVPRADNGEVLSSGKYYLRSDGTESGTVRFTWFR